MSTKTQNLDLNKPEWDDTYDIDEYNENFDILDEAHLQLLTELGYRAKRADYLPGGSAADTRAISVYDEIAEEETKITMLEVFSYIKAKLFTGISGIVKVSGESVSSAEAGVDYPKPSSDVAIDTTITDDTYLHATKSGVDKRITLSNIIEKLKQTFAVLTKFAEMSSVALNDKIPFYDVSAQADKAMYVSSLRERFSAVDCGYYDGSNASGADGPTTIPLRFKPDIILIFCRYGPTYSPYNTRPYQLISDPKCITSQSASHYAYGAPGVMMVSGLTESYAQVNEAIWRTENSVFSNKTTTYAKYSNGYLYFYNRYELGGNDQITDEDAICMQFNDDRHFFIAFRREPTT